MAIKYTLTVNSQKQQDWLVEIDFPSYTGEPIALIGDQNPILLEYNGGGSDDPFSSHIITNSLTIRVYDDNVDIAELQEIADGSVRCRAYYNGVLKHQGFIISDGVQEPDSGVSSLITIKSIDGLEFLEAMPFTWADNYGLITVGGQVSVQRCPMNAIRLALYASSNLNNRLPIRWSTSLKSVQYPTDDMLAGRNRIIYDGKLLMYSSNSVKWYLEEILKTAQCWLYQRDGYWWIENKGDTIRNGGFFNGYEITDSTTAQTATPISIDLNTPDLVNEFVSQDQYWLVKKPLGGTNVVYEDTTNNNNVIPNGGFDIVSTGIAVDWRMSDSTVVGSAPPINGRAEGYSAEIDSTFDTEDRTVMTGEIPIDTTVLFKDALLGFKWLPISGYDLKPDGTIDFSKFPLWISVKLKTGAEELYLNEFGYWSDKNASANAQVINTYYTEATSGFYVIFDADKDFYPGDQIVVSALRGGQFQVYNIVFDQTMDVESGLDFIVSKIPNSVNPPAPANGIFLNGVTNSPFNNAYTQKYADYYKKINIEGVNQLRFNDVLDIQFQSKGLSSDIKLPSRYGKLSIEILAKAGSYMRLDDVYFRVNNNHDKYEIRDTSSKAPIENYTVGISSSFSGHMWSNYMDSYATSDLSLNWTVNGSAGKSLTQLYGEFVLNWRNNPRKIFDGSIDRVVQSGDFLTIKGRKYIVLNSSIQGDGISRVLAFEAVLNEKSYSVTHKGTIENNN